MFKREYHLLPVEETGRPSMDTASDVSSHHDTDKSDFKTLHFSLYFRFISFSLFLAAVIILRLGDKDAIPSMVFLSLALTQNFYVIARHLITRWLVVKISFNSSGKQKIEASKLLAILPYVVDGVLLLCLLISLPIGHSKTRYSYYWVSRDVLPAYIMSYVALPFYLLASLDGGKPSSLTVYFKLKTKGGENRVEQHRVSARDDVEAAQHETET